ncbi:hypothetical protein ASZ90_007048 [hydrocarbon metagenome]|uniref:Uncharacterized protein n=1 Tax=hydrocarbon metagenome TaxID=938273 RepID=A0A0W8FQS9_9ZZZZ
MTKKIVILVRAWARKGNPELFSRGGRDLKRSQANVRGVGFNGWLNLVD